MGALEFLLQLHETLRAMYRSIGIFRHMSLEDALLLHPGGTANKMEKMKVDIASLHECMQQGVSRLSNEDKWMFTCKAGDLEEFVTHDFKHITSIFGYVDHDKFEEIFLDKCNKSAFDPAITQTEFSVYMQDFVDVGVEELLTLIPEQLVLDRGIYGLPTRFTDLITGKMMSLYSTLDMRMVLLDS